MIKYQSPLLTRSVHIVVDGVSSMRPLDRATALDRMRVSGATLTTTESVLFEILQDSTDPHFKEVSKLLKGHNKLPKGLL